MKLEAMELQFGTERRQFYLRPGTSDTGVIGQVFVDRAYDLSGFRRFPDIERHLQMGRASGKRPLIIDAGANIGATSVYLSLQYRDALVVAIEPEASNFQLLVENTVGLPVVPLPCALASEPAVMRVVDAGDGYWAFQTRAVAAEDATEDDVDCITIDEIFDAYKEDCFPFMVKIDIEGAEQEVFRDHTSWVSRTPVLMVEPHDWLLPRQATALPFLRTVVAYDRDFVLFGENVLSIANDLDSLVPAGLQKSTDVREIVGR